jgi:hypothetical protein
MSAIGNVSAVSPQIQAATTGKAFDAQKQEGQAALKLIDAAAQVAKTAQSSGPKATGNTIDITV